MWWPPTYVYSAKFSRASVMSNRIGLMCVYTVCTLPWIPLSDMPAHALTITRSNSPRPATHIKPASVTYSNRYMCKKVRFSSWNIWSMSVYLVAVADGEIWEMCTCCQTLQTSITDVVTRLTWQLSAEGKFMKRSKGSWGCKILIDLACDYLCSQLFNSPCICSEGVLTVKVICLRQIQILQTKSLPWFLALVMF